MSRDIKTEDYFGESFRRLDAELEAVMTVLSEGVPLDPEILLHLPWLKPESPPPLSESHPSETAQLLSIAFELLTMVEQRVAFELRSWRRAQHGTAAVNGLWPRILNDLTNAGRSEEEVLAALKKVQVEPVLTAHPTEAKRPAVREKHLAIYHKLAEWAAARSDPHRARRLRASVRSELETLWMTGEIFIRRPSVTEELQNAVYYLREVFPEVVLRLDRSLELAWQDAGWSLDKLRAENAFPQIRFATWIGGDRDGHPLVTPQVTAESLAELRRHAARLHRRWLRRAADALTLARPFAEVPAALHDANQVMANSLGERGRHIFARNDHEPWRAWLYLLREKIGRFPDEGGYQKPDEYLADLSLAHDSLLQTNARHAANEWLTPLIRLAEIFGFHLAALDVRQNSTSYDNAAAELFAAADIPDGANFAKWSEPDRQRFLLEELHNPRPLLAPGQPIGDAAATALGPLQVLAAHANRHGSDGLGQLIVSMTRQPSDLLLLHLLCREAGLANRDDGGRWRSRLPVSPLFETEKDLAHADAILTEYFAALPPSPGTLQPAMVGYSDSNKDAGVFASQWSIYSAQERITQVCRDHGTTPQLFHGRGGTIGRGAGPTQWFLRALPPGSLQGPIRLTEQGEVLPRKYAHEGNAHYHLELLMAGVSGAVAAAPQHGAMQPTHRSALMRIASDSAAAYRALLHSEHFVDFYRTATPIDALEAGTFGSRPPRRTGGGTLGDLRAIPWVFSWTQSRFYLPGWFGVGSGLAALQKHDPASYQELRDSLPDLPFLRYVLTNVESSLVSANLELMTAYGGLCPNPKLRERVMESVRKEFAHTRTHLAAFLGDDFSKRRVRMSKTLALREHPLLHLHRQQIELLRDWRANDSPVETSTGKFDRRFLALQLTINAIASGLRETG